MQCGVDGLLQETRSLNPISTTNFTRPSDSNLWANYAHAPTTSRVAHGDSGTPSRAARRSHNDGSFFARLFAMILMVL